MRDAEGAVAALSKAYPWTSRVNELGHLEVGGCDVVDLADAHGTPLYIYDERTLREQCRAYAAAFAECLDDVTVVYAGKCFLCVAMCELIAEEGLSLDVSSGGELSVAQVASFPPKRICLHGNNKSAAELSLALDLGVGRVIIDSSHEMALLERLAAERGVQQRVLLRVAPGVVPATHPSLQTGQVGSKFGFPLLDVDSAVRAALSSPHLDLIGIHCHIGSQIAELDVYGEEIAVLVAELAKWRDLHGLEGMELDIGGGLGIDYVEGDNMPSINEFVELIARTLRNECKRHGLVVPHLLVEPGRSIAGRAGLTAYRVGSLKMAAGLLYVAVDGGMSDNLRPMLYGSVYQALVANRAGARPDHDVKVVGKHCESGDVLISKTRIPAVESGDVLVTPATGAYTYALANNFNGQPRPAVVFLRDGEAHVVVERESWTDITRLNRSLKRGAS